MYVALDLETTGLDPDADRITEVGAIRFDAGGRELAAFETLVNPGRPIPQFVQRLTGVTDEAVCDAPPLSEIAGQLVDFIGADVVVGHNISFDLGCLQREGVRLTTPSVDTAELSRLLMPSSQARGLIDLAATLGVAAEVHHRALADARTAAGVFNALRARADGLDPASRGQLSRLVALHSPALANVLGGVDESAATSLPVAPGLRKPPHWPSLERSEAPSPVSREALDRAFAAAAEVFPGFEVRSQQQEMAEYVRNGVNGGGQYLVEAGTGVGKSLAYLIPAALYALQNGERVVISTNTINLQEQLLQHDIPALRRVLVASGAIAAEDALRAALLKGRANYLCLRKWTASYGANMADPDFAKLAAGMLLWLPETETGDRSELSLDSTDWATWQRFSAQDADCLARQNPFVRDGYCFLQRSRRASESAHLIIVNHALLLADVASGGSALPGYRHLVIDEAHNLEERATQQFGGSVTARNLHEALDAIHRPSRSAERRGGVTALLDAFPRDSGVRIAGEQLGKAVEATVPLVAKSLEPLMAFLPARGEDDRALVTSGTRASPDWQAVEIAIGKLDAALFDIYQRAMTSARLLGSTTDVGEPDAIASEIESACRRLEELRLRLSNLVGRGNDEQIVWIGRERDGTASLNVAPLDVGPMLAEHLFGERATVIATSATLAADRDMTYSARRLGMPEADAIQLGSPFDYRKSTLLAAVDGLPTPDQRSYNTESGQAIARLVTASQGRALALFTSHGSLRAAAGAAREALEAEGIAVLVQGEDGNPRQLTEALKSDPRAVIFGTSSFWEGVDVRGDALSNLIIARLPFAVPTDPVYRARSEQFENPFGEYALPSAILRFRQGFGRLIRDREDRGVVSILDRRIFEKSYGRQFVASLPDCTRVKGDSELVESRIREWLSR